MNSFGLIRLSILAAVLVPALGLAQQIQIESPADGTVVNPGQTVNIRVTSPRGAIVSFVGVIGEDPLGASSLAKSVPAQFSITIPSNISTCRRYMLTAIGRTAAGELVESRIGIDVERPDTPVSIISFQFPSRTLEADTKDRPFNLIILATFSDGSNFEVTESSYVTYQSSNTAVVTADGLGAITAAAPGRASIRVAYKNPNGGSVQVSVPVTVLPPSKDGM